jgi:hypothetical protein
MQGNQEAALPDFFDTILNGKNIIPKSLQNIPNRQKYTKVPHNIPNGYKIDQMPKIYIPNCHNINQMAKNIPNYHKIM